MTTLHRAAARADAGARGTPRHADPWRRLEAYIPGDRRRALARGETLPDRVYGAALFADISGFTTMTETFANELGARRGADELTRHLNRVFHALIEELARFGGEVIYFSGDALTCWVDAHGRLRQIFRDDEKGVYGRGFMTAEIPLPEPGAFRAPTFYNRYGDVFGWSCFAISVLMCTRRLIRRKSKSLAAT
jgi:class 3 adenylate cyclase